MSAARGLFLRIFGFTMLKFICCYSDGSLLTDQCQSMAINHDTDQPQGQDLNIFTVDPDTLIVDSSQVGKGITVTLSAASGSFMGYMLEARECDDCPPAGKFSGIDSAKSVLLCGDQAVAHPNNNDKTSVQVTWTPQATGQFFFRAAIAQTFGSVSPKKAIILPTTTTLPPETMPMATSPPATTPTMMQTVMQTMTPTLTQTITQTTTMQTTTSIPTTTPTTLQTMMTTATDTPATITTRPTTKDTSTAPPTSAVNNTQTGLTVFTTPNLQATDSDTGDLGSNPVPDRITEPKDKHEPRVTQSSGSSCHSSPAGFYGPAT
ncbi:uncharacterized protein LOC130233242 [Danio aesculapii]|uniref:uncharacterized protein LOC130233242 n=1 Tax=Danio aesculapii TaxID=1142201 RepID=UPI0024BF14B0|nr:uncharacterized protein LOC130233242 [Danio aesculapii]